MQPGEGYAAFYTGFLLLPKRSFQEPGMWVYSTHNLCAIGGAALREVNTLRCAEVKHRLVFFPGSHQEHISRIG